MRINILWLATIFILTAVRILFHKRNFLEFDCHHLLVNPLCDGYFYYFKVSLRNIFWPGKNHPVNWAIIYTQLRPNFPQNREGNSNKREYITKTNDYARWIITI